MTEPRLPLRAASDDPRLAELYAKGLQGEDGEVLNIFAALGNHPDLLRRWLVFAAHVLSKSTLTPRDRELLILRTGWLCRSAYEFGQHVTIARGCGITDAEIERVKLGPDATGWSEHDRLLLQAADELHRESAISTPTWELLIDELETEQLLDLIFAVGNYHLVAMVLNTLHVPLDAGVPEVSFPV
jgi:alkylhydroperoxidase family enzyme